MLKSVLSTIAIASLSLSAQAADFVNQDGSVFSQLCIAAVESQEKLQETAEQNGISKFAINAITCNDMSLNDFVKKYRTEQSSEIVSVSAFKNVNNSLEGDICIAAATSNSAFEKALRATRPSFNAETVMCNGQPLASFAKQYNEAFNG